MTTKPAAVRAAAQRLFLAQGYVRTSMDAIAAEAGVTKQTVYRYYTTKSQLFSAVLGELAEGLQADLLDIIPASPPAGPELEDTLSAAALRILDHVLEPTYLSLVRTTVAEAPDFPELPERLRTEFVERGAAALAQLLDSSGVPSLAEGHEPGAVQRLFAGSLLTFMLEGLLGDPVAARQRAQAQLPAIVRVLAAALVSSMAVPPRASRRQAR